MTERESPHLEWTPIAHLPKIGYFVGAEYQGNYRRDLKINLALLETICRQAELPPLTLQSEKWDPPAAVEPEPIGPGLAAFKRKQLAPASASLSLKFGGLPIFLETIEWVTHRESAFGWRIKVKDGQILHALQSQNPSEKQLPALFARKLEQWFRVGIVLVSLAESLQLRTDKYRRFSMTSLNAFLSAALASLPVVDLVTHNPISLSRTLADFSLLVISPNVWHGISALAKAMTLAEFSSREDQITGIPDFDSAIRRALVPENPGASLTNLVRCLSFPDRYEQEDRLAKSRPLINKLDFGHRSLPLSPLFLPTYRALSSLASHRQPFFRIQPELSGRKLA